MKLRICALVCIACAALALAGCSDSETAKNELPDDQKRAAPGGGGDGLTGGQ